MNVLATNSLSYARELVFCQAYIAKCSLLGRPVEFSRQDACDLDTKLDQPFPWAVVFMMFLYGMALGSFFRRFIAAPVASFLVGQPENKRPGRVAPPEERKVMLVKKKRHAKFVSSALEFVVYTLFFVVGCALVFKQEWIWPSSQWWTDTPSDKLSTDLAFFYLAYASRYMCQFVFVFIDPRKSDFVEMQMHHIVTVSLVCTSYAYRMVKIGLVIMVVFDIADPLLHAAKLVTYCKEAAPQNSAAKKYYSIAADVLFGLFALVFIVTRIGLFSYLVYSVTYESVIYMSVSQEYVAGLFEVGMATHVCVALIWALYALNWFWMSLLVRLIIKALRGEELKDERSDLDEVVAEIFDSAARVAKLD